MEEDMKLQEPCQKSQLRPSNELPGPFLANPDKWIFTDTQLENTPSFRDGIISFKECWYRCRSADLIESLGRNIGLKDVTIITAIIYMHRFYQFHSFSNFHRDKMVPVFIMLAAKVQEEPRSILTIFGVWRRMNSDSKEISTSFRRESEEFKQVHEESTLLEAILIQTMGFEFTIDIPKAHLVNIITTLSVPKFLQDSATQLLRIAIMYTPLILKYRSITVALIVFHTALHWQRLEYASIPDQSTPLNPENPVNLFEWFSSEDPRITWEDLDTGMYQLIQALNSLPIHYKEKLKNPPPNRRRHHQPVKMKI